MTHGRITEKRKNDRIQYVPVHVALNTILDLKHKLQQLQVVHLLTLGFASFLRKQLQITGDEAALVHVAHLGKGDSKRRKNA